MWRALRHPNVVPLLGATMTENRFVMVSEWMVRGDINEFVKTDTNVDRLRLVCSSFGSPFTIDGHMITVAGRRCKRIDLYA